MMKSGYLFFCRYAAIFFITSMTLTIVLSSVLHAQDDAGQKKFKSPEEAFKVLLEAARSNDVKELLAIFGPGGKDVISSGDAVADRWSRERFIKAVGEALKYSTLDNGTVLPLIGKDECPFPIPIVKSGQEWVFSTEEGRQEIINRRIGRNELSTIKVSLSYVDAQREYAGKDRNGDGILQYAQHFLSGKGMKDGLYWEAAAGEDMSPLGPLIAHAAEEGYTIRKSEKPAPYHGYYFRILKSQGKSAPGGELDYLKKGRMTEGFGLLAYPAVYGVSGIMTFMVNQESIVYEKDLGPKTEETVKTMMTYDPDKTWKKAQ